MKRISFLIAVPLTLAAAAALAQSPDEVLVVVNKRSPASREIGQYYLNKRSVPLKNLCTIDTTPDEMIQRPVYDRDIEPAVTRCLRSGGLVETILYMVTTSGVPLRILTSGGNGMTQSSASVDSELTLVYQHIHGVKTGIEGFVPNPFFRQRDTPFRHPLFPLYLVTRLAAWDVAEAKRLVDLSLAARNFGRFVIDTRAGDTNDGNQWLRAAALLLPKDRVILDDSATVLTGVKEVIGYASWGSNDHAHTQRFLHFQWLPGAIATEFVSTDGRTLRRPPDTWKLGNWTDASTWFADTPQSLSADYLHEGASGVSGQVEEPYLQYCPRPDFVLPAYFSGRTLAESFYMGIPALSWMNVVFGDPLMRLIQ